MFILIDKPKGITSHDVVDTLRKITKIKKIGHGGTLDPMATGLLVVGVGRESTKKLGEITKNTDKVYEAKVCLGVATDTDDKEGKEISRNDNLKPSSEEISKVLKNFEGEIEQVPPIFSAIKLKGKKAYELARKGQEVALQPRKVVIHSIELVDYKYPIIEIRCSVSSGTYIRSLARDIGKSLGTVAHLSALRRTQIGQYSVENAVELGNLSDQNWKEHTI